MNLNLTCKPDAVILPLRSATPGYLSPQTALGLTLPGVHDDIRGLCVTAFQLITGSDYLAELELKLHGLEERQPAEAARLAAFLDDRIAAGFDPDLLAAAEFLGIVGLDPQARTFTENTPLYGCIQKQCLYCILQVECSGVHH